ncbi:hypothetical protein H1R20_g8941, partial [Candolleomyces eurysporus]
MSTAELDSTPAAWAPETTGDETTAGGGDRLDGMRAVLTRASRMWDNGQVLTCAFVKPAGDAIRQAKVISVAKEWERYANIKLDFESAAKNPLDAIIRISFDPYLVVIEWLKRTQNPPLTEEETRRNVLNVYNRYAVSNYSTVDLTSIMMYWMPAQFNEQEIEIPPNYELSALDKAFAFLNYPFIGGPTSSDASQTLDNALNTIGVTGKFRESITAEFNVNDWRGVRAEFTRWALNAKAEASKKEAVAEREAQAEIGIQTDS